MGRRRAECRLYQREIERATAVLKDELVPACARRLDAVVAEHYRKVVCR